MPLRVCACSLPGADKEAVEQLVRWPDHWQPVYADQPITTCSPRGDDERSWDVGNSVGFAPHAQAAAEFRSNMRRRTAVDCVCAACGLYRPAQQLQAMAFSALPHSDVLRADSGSTAEEPRHAHTTVQPSAGGPRYCMQPAGCLWRCPTAPAHGIHSASLVGAVHSYAQYLQCQERGHVGLQLQRACDACCGTPVEAAAAGQAAARMVAAAGQGVFDGAASTPTSTAAADLTAHVKHCGILGRELLVAWLTRLVQAAVLYPSVCGGCLASLQRGKAPKESYVRVDTGSLPIARSVAEQLQPLTLAESLLVSVLRPVRSHVVLRPPGSTRRANDTYQWSMRGHVVAFPNPSPGHLAQCLPCPLEEMPNLIQVRCRCACCVLCRLHLLVPCAAWCLRGWDCGWDGPSQAPNLRKILM